MLENLVIKIYVGEVQVIWINVVINFTVDHQQTAQYLPGTLNQKYIVTTIDLKS